MSTPLPHLESSRYAAAPAQFGAVLERVPTAGGQWSSTVTAPTRKSPLAGLVSWILLFAVLGGGYYGWKYWSEEHGPLAREASEYVDGSGVDYVSPVSGIGGNFAGPPVETQLGLGAPAAVFDGREITMIVVAFPAPISEEALAAAAAPYGSTALRTGTVAVGTTTYAAVVTGPDARSVDAVFEHFTERLRLPGGATI